jgi:hypothetical protein
VRERERESERELGRKRARRTKHSMCAYVCLLVCVERVWRAQEGELASTTYTDPEEEQPFKWVGGFKSYPSKERRSRWCTQSTLMPLQRARPTIMISCKAFLFEICHSFCHLQVPHYFEFPTPNESVYLINSRALLLTNSSFATFTAYPSLSASLRATGMFPVCKRGMIVTA